MRIDQNLMASNMDICNIIISEVSDLGGEMFVKQLAAELFSNHLSDFEKQARSLTPEQNGYLKALNDVITSIKNIKVLLNKKPNQYKN